MGEGMCIHGVSLHEPCALCHPDAEVELLRLEVETHKARATRAEKERDDYRQAMEGLGDMAGGLNDQLAEARRAPELIAAWGRELAELEHGCCAHAMLLYIEAIESGKWRAKG